MGLKAGFLDRLRDDWALGLDVGCVLVSDGRLSFLRLAFRSLSLELVTVRCCGGVDGLIAASESATMFVTFLSCSAGSPE